MVECQTPVMTLEITNMVPHLLTNFVSIDLLLERHDFVYLQPELAHISGQLAGYLLQGNNLILPTDYTHVKHTMYCYARHFTAHKETTLTLDFFSLRASFVL